MKSQRKRLLRYVLAVTWSIPWVMLFGILVWTALLHPEFRPSPETMTEFGYVVRTTLLYAFLLIIAYGPLVLIVVRDGTPGRE